MSTLLDISHAVGAVLGSEFCANPSAIDLGSVESIVAGRVHEATGALRQALALSIASRTTGKVFWIAIGGRARTVRARGLRAFLDPSRFVALEVASRDETLWAAEEALRCRGAGAVIIDIDRGPDLFEGRRLQIAAQCGGGVGVVLVRRQVQSSGCQTRWNCMADPRAGADWLWELRRNKQGLPGTWSVRGDPDPALTHPPDLLPSTQHCPPASHDPFRLTTTPRALVSPASARPLAPA